MNFALIFFRNLHFKKDVEVTPSHHSSNTLDRNVYILFHILNLTWKSFLLCFKVMLRLLLCILVFPQICITAMANLMQASIKEGSPRTQFSKDRDIIPFIESHWEGITTFAKRVKQSMHSSVSNILQIVDTMLRLT